MMQLDIWVRAVVESEKASETPGLNPEVFPNLQFIKTHRNILKLESDEDWKKFLETYFKRKGVKVPENHSLEDEQEVSVVAKQIDEELFRGEVEIPEEYIGEDPEYSVFHIY